MLAEQFDGRAQRFGCTLDAALAAAGGEPAGLIETEREVSFDEEVLECASERAS